MDETQTVTAGPPRTRTRHRKMLQNPAAIVSIREVGGMSQNQLAIASKVAQAALSRIESGDSSARPGTLKKLASALRVPVAAIMRDPEAAA